MTFTEIKLIDNQENEGKDTRIIEKAKFFKDKYTKVAEKHFPKFEQYLGVYLEAKEEKPIKPVPKDPTIEEPVQEKNTEVDSDQKELVTKEKPKATSKKEIIIDYLIEEKGISSEELEGKTKKELVDLLD